MAKPPKTWMLHPKKDPKPKPTEALKAEVSSKAKKLVESVLKPKHVKSMPKNYRFNYITDIWTKWHQGNFYFGATYACPGPTAISPSFETKFARLAYCGGNRFNLSYMRHTEKWFELFPNLKLDECLDSIREDWHFGP